MEKLNKDIAGLNLWTFSVATLTGYAFLFDLYLLICSSNKFLALVSIFCLIVGLAGAFKWQKEGFNYYILVYLIPLALHLLSGIPNAEALGIDRTEFIISAWATVFSALLPILGSIITVPSALFIGWIARWVESKI
ncbi:hypothetical protein ACENF1_004573 [Vibrio parahaemolyticus]